MRNDATSDTSATSSRAGSGTRKALVLSAATGALAAGGAWLRERRRLVSAVDPDLRHPILWTPLPLDSPVGVRAARSKVVGLPSTVPLTVRRSTRLLPASTEGAHRVPVTLYEPRDRQRPSGAVLYLHGGGFMFGAVDWYHRTCSMLAERLGVLVVSVDYRLAPEHPFPAGLDDCRAALAWLHDQAADLGVDPSRVAVAGDSAGGGLAACLAQRAADERVPVAFQALVYPMLDDRTPLVRQADDRGALVWTPESNRYGWSSYLGREPSREGVPPHAVAARRVDLSGLPPAWIGVGERDLFYAEDVRYAERLREAGVAVQLEVVPGMYHAADLFLPNASRMQQFTASWMDAVGAAIAPGRH